LRLGVFALDPMRFCMITTFYPPYSFGGDAVYIYRLVQELARRGHSIDVIHDADSYLLLKTEGLKADYPNHSNVTVHALKSKGGFLSPLLTQQTGVPFLKQKRIREVLGSKDYDVIHYHNMSLIGLSALQYGNAIKLYTTHEHWLVCPMHVLWKYDREVCTSQNCIRCQIHGKRPPQWWRYTKLMPNMLNYVDMFISPSRFTLKKHHEMGLDIPMVHIPYFLSETKSDDDLETVSPHPRPYFLFVGRLEKIKGVQNLIPLFRENPEFELLIAGEGTYSEQLRGMAAGAENIQFLGKLGHSKLHDYYKHARAVIVPSICYEVFGIIIIEAFALKTPVIVNNLGALPEVVDDSGGGIIYNNQEELLAAIRRFAAEDTLREELGQNGYKAFLRYWNEESHMQQYLGLIQKVQQKRLAGAMS
jgi:glycosyltransferase involved in cell wall biosynthesis